jgi:fructuronate reductase
VLEERLPNSYLPDTPQRIATDTSQKLAIRFGGTVRAYAEKGSASKLEMIPLVIAAWLRYLTAVGDDGAPMELSADPMLDEMQKTVRPEWFGKGCDRAAVEAVLKNEALFGADLVSVGLADKIAAYLDKMLAGAGAVRKVLHDAVTA